ncbi:MarR family transcriptional regulator [Breoghania sp.]|uniref:MarR family winged helix-turn-helix transcriptional regulator n=1 Tax=Breoghania sp. TaxID=2065378 RepID=UPI0026175EB1|nr:MarR family transcriptional regulator [Breoghania sp.]MDJ0931109.1 MarR family transcriptional regulator [Breoghania sp.]
MSSPTDPTVPDPNAPELSSRDDAVSPAILRLEPDLALLVRMLDGIYRRRDYPMERAHYLLMLRLLDGPRTSGELASELVLDHSTVTRQIAAVEKNGYARRRANPADGRSALFEATEHGIAQCAAMRDVRLERLEHLLAKWSEEDRMRFADLTARFIEALLELEVSREV